MSNLDKLRIVGQQGEAFIAIKAEDESEIGTRRGIPAVIVNTRLKMIEEPLELDSIVKQGDWEPIEKSLDSPQKMMINQSFPDSDLEEKLLKVLLG